MTGIQTMGKWKPTIQENPNIPLEQAYPWRIPKPPPNDAGIPKHKLLVDLVWGMRNRGMLENS